MFSEEGILGFFVGEIVDWGFILFLMIFYSYEKIRCSMA